MGLTPKEIKTVLFIMLAAGIGALFTERFLKPGLKGTLGL